jgi:hypothetical protein
MEIYIYAFGTAAIIAAVAWSWWQVAELLWALTEGE